MKIRKRTTIASLAGAALVLTAVMWEGTQSPEASSDPVQPAAEQELVLLQAHPFQLAVPELHTWRAEQATYDRGQLLVLQADPASLLPHQSYDPVIYVGAQTVERVNTGAESGYLVAILPGEVELSEAPIFFGDPELPERVTAVVAADQLALARAAGARATDSARVMALTRDPVTLADGSELRVFASHLIEEFSPGEGDLISGLRAPRLQLR